jgi:hypothetical protein
MKKGGTSGAAKKAASPIGQHGFVHYLLSKTTESPGYFREKVQLQQAVCYFYLRVPDVFSSEANDNNCRSASASAIL